MALLELNFADHAKLAKEGRNFNCAVCPERTKKLRRCMEDRENFTEADNPSVFPIQIQKGGTQYGFCPAKVTWDHDLNDVYNLLVVSHTTGVMLYDGGISDQPDWYIDLLAWFGQVYGQLDWYKKAQTILGDGTEAPKNGSNSGHAKNLGRSRNRQTRTSVKGSH